MTRREPSEPERPVATPAAGEAVATADDALPVVARLVVEIRSDGTRTVARGAIEERVSGVSTAVRAEGSTPWALAGQLVRALATLPSLARRRGAARPRAGLRAALTKLVLPGGRRDR